MRSAAAGRREEGTRHRPDDGCPVLGLIGLLILAVEREHLPAPDAERILNGARENGFRVAGQLMDAFHTRLRQLKERE